ncbi:MAG TPA: hypothetical protein VF608_08375 [Thermoanaerobaculia bacterium]
MKRNFLGLFLIVSIAPAAMSMTCDEFNAKLKTTYGFEPSKLEEAALPVKTAEMDVIWHAVHEDATLVPCLKAALSTTSDNWFFFDGTQLLMAVDPSKESKETLVRALGRVSLDDVDLRTWIELASKLGLEGFDTASLGKRWFNHPRAEYYLPEHGAFRVDRGTGAMFVFGSMEEKFATPAIVELTREGKGQAKDVALMLLLFQATPEALAALTTINTAGLSADVLANLNAVLNKRGLIEPRENPKTTRAEFVKAFTALLADDEQPFDELIIAVPDGEHDLVAVSTAEDVELLRSVRRHYAAKGSPEAMEFYKQFTQILMTLVVKEPGAKPNVN